MQATLPIPARRTTPFHVSRLWQTLYYYRGAVVRPFCLDLRHIAFPPTIVPRPYMPAITFRGEYSGCSARNDFHMTNAEFREVLLKGQFSFSRPSLWFARARLYSDRLELTGWRLWERYHRFISLRHILQVDVPSADRLLLWMTNGQTLRLCIDDARRWQEAIARQLKDSSQLEDS